MSLNTARLLPELKTAELYPDETAYFSNVETEMEYDNGGGYPGAGEQLYSAKGALILTNIRIIYIPASSGVLKSFVIPLQNLEDCKTVEKWFSGTIFTGSCRSVQGEGLSKEWGNIKFTFKSKAGADFMNSYLYWRSQMGIVPAQYVEELPAYSNSNAGETEQDQPPAFI